MSSRAKATPDATATRALVLASTSVKAAAQHAAPAAKATSAVRMAKIRTVKPTPVRLLSGGNPQIAKADGDAPVRAYIAALSGWQRERAIALDALIVKTIPGVRKAVKWNSPFYGVEGNGWFIALHTFARFLRVTFFVGRSLRPLPPGPSKDPQARYLDLHEDDALDKAQFAKWLKQAAAKPGYLAPTR